MQVLTESFRIVQFDHATMASELQRFPQTGPSYLSLEHAAQRAAMIRPGRAIDDRELGAGRASSILGEHTTHVSVVDRRGNVAVLTQTLCRQYGAKVATPGLGFPYNCCLEFLDFEDPHSPFYLSPGATYPTSMAPTIVRSDGWVMGLGSAGSDRIPPSVTGVISNVVDGGMSVRDAVVWPRVLWNSAHEPPRVCIEIADPVTTRDADRLQSRGFESTVPSPLPARLRSATLPFLAPSTRSTMTSRQGSSPASATRGDSVSPSVHSPSPGKR